VVVCKVAHTDASSKGPRRSRGEHNQACALPCGGQPSSPLTTHPAEPLHSIISSRRSVDASGPHDEPQHCASRAASRAGEGWLARADGRASRERPTRGGHLKGGSSASAVHHGIRAHARGARFPTATLFFRGGSKYLSCLFRADWKQRQGARADRPHAVSSATRHPYMRPVERPQSFQSELGRAKVGGGESRACGETTGRDLESLPHVEGEAGAHIIGGVELAAFVRGRSYGGGVLEESAAGRRQRAVHAAHRGQGGRGGRRECYW